MIPATVYPVKIIFEDGEEMEMPSSSPVMAEKLRAIMEKRRDVRSASIAEPRPAN